MLAGSVVAQSVKELEEQRKQALKRLETTSKVLNETQKNQRTTLNKLNIIKSNIQERKKLITHIEKEISVLDSEIIRLTEENRKLEKQLAELKSDYAKMVQEAYINRSIYAKMMFVLSAQTFDQSVRRLRYLQEYSEYRKIQVAQIEKTKAEIQSKANELSKNKRTQVDIKSVKVIEANKLATDQKKQNLALNDLKRKEKTLRVDLQKQQKIASDVNKKIERLIAEEVRKAEERARAEEKARIAREAKAAQEAKAANQAKETNKTTAPERNTPTSGTPAKSSTPTTSKPSSTVAESAVTRELALVSGNFASNAGRLPWPVDKGFISGRYGVQAHPVLKYVTTNNKGIYIQTPARSNARAVFDGIVTQRFSVPGSNNGVIIQHGQYRTVYANLTDIYVSVGQKVNAKQSLGRIYTDSDNENKTELFFQIWKDRTILNPESWIAR
jgi:septal ring factor EnvC (AmiA/AmiB activator)